MPALIHRQRYTASPHCRFKGHLYRLTVLSRCLYVVARSASVASSMNVVPVLGDFVISAPTAVDMKALSQLAKVVSQI